MLASEFSADCRSFSVSTACVRAARKTRVYGMAAAYRDLATQSAYRHFIAAHASSDRFFFLSRRSYLAIALTPLQRLQAALTHYRYDSETFDDEYLTRVYRESGLVLWHRRVADVEYEIRLVSMVDVPNEGALSIVLTIGGQRACVISYSIVHAGLIWSGAEGDEALIPFVTRKHTLGDRAYQAQFNKAFDRATPAHLCFGALTGVSLAQGHNRVIGIAPEKHPAYAHSLRSKFLSTYEDFWKTLSARPISRYGFLIDLPVRMTPIEALEPSRRKRALARRFHIEEVRQSAVAAIAVHLKWGH
jgi:uncharacterized protein VirK/YbjX